jgi:UDP-N-acetylmuramoyl-tripeptide--D-alanyl-D-alanine ligase
VIRLAWHEVEALGLGGLHGDGEIAAIKADSREVGPGDLFIAVNAGVEFVDDARARGAATLVPDDQEAALAALASLVRSKSDARVVAVVGSAGKTTTKDILGALCAPHASTIWADRSLNNEIGLPLTVCRLEPETEILVTEMGMRGLGQVAHANAEAIAALPTGGTAVVPATAEALAPFLTRDDVRVRRFAADDVVPANGVTRFRVGDSTVELALPFTQRHLALNTLAALHTYDALGLPLERAHEGVAAIRLSPWRGEEIALPDGGFVVNDAYNANPDSMRVALEHLADRAGGRRKVAILGEMAELGSASAEYHREIGRLAAELGIEVIGVGEPARGYEPAAWAATRDEALALARARVEPGDAVLVKASRAVGLEGFADEIANSARAWSQSS